MTEPTRPSQPSAPCECGAWPRPGTYSIAGRVEPIVILGLAPRGELRIVRQDGTIGSVAEHRVRIERLHRRDLS